MSDRSNEELSALMDGEATEMELRRTLKSLDSDSELLQKWRRYHVSRSVIQGDMKEAQAAQFVRLDISQAVSEAIDNEPAHSVDVPSKPGWAAKILQPLSSVAVAASVSAMVVFGWQTFQQQGGQLTDPALVSSSATPASTLVASAGNSSSGNTVSRFNAQPATGYVAVSDSQFATQSRPVVQQEVVRLPVNKNQRLNHYLVSHSGNAALNTVSGSMSYTRVVHIEP